MILVPRKLGKYAYNEGCLLSFPVNSDQIRPKVMLRKLIPTLQVRSESKSNEGKIADHLLRGEILDSKV